MRWVAMGLAVVSWALSALAFGAGFLAVLPARGGEPILTFAGESLWAALGVAIVATGLGIASLVRARKTRRWASSIVAAVLASLALLTSGTMALLVLALDAQGDASERAIAEAKTRHETALAPSDIARARTVTADSVVAEWARDHDAADAHHRGEVLALSWNVGGTDWVDGTTCMFLLWHGDVVCCLAHGQPEPPRGMVTFVARYAGTDRRHSPPGHDQGKLVLESCQQR